MLGKSQGQSHTQGTLGIRLSQGLYGKIIPINIMH